MIYKTMVISNAQNRKTDFPAAMLSPAYEFYCFFQFYCFLCTEADGWSQFWILKPSL